MKVAKVLLTTLALFSVSGCSDPGEEMINVDILDSMKLATSQGENRAEEVVGGLFGLKTGPSNFKSENPNDYKERGVVRVRDYWWEKTDTGHWKSRSSSNPVFTVDIEGVEAVARYMERKNNP